MASLKDTNILGKLVVTDKIIKSGGTSNDILLANGDTITKSSLGAEITGDTGVTTISNTGSGNAITSLSISADTRTLTVNKGNSFLPLSGGTMTGPIVYSNASGNNKANNYISAGGGYSTGSGRLGLKLVACDQGDVQTGIGMDLTGFSYETCLSTARATDTGTSYITFATHTTETTAYKRLGYFSASNSADPTVEFNVAGRIVCGKITFPQEHQPSIYSSSNIQGIYVDHGVETPQVKTSAILAPTTSGGTTYGVGTDGQVLKSNGTTVYWGTDNSGSGGLTSLPTRLAEYSTSGYGDANEATIQGWHYMTTTGTNRPPFKQSSNKDYRIMSTAYSSSWVQQIATDFRGNDMFLRRKENGTWKPWTPIVRFQDCTADHQMQTITDNAIPKWDTGGTAMLQNSGITIDDSNNMTVPGYIKTAENKMGIKFRTHTDYETGIVYGTSGNEALTIAIQKPVTAFQIVYGTKPSAYGTNTWQSVTPLFQTKDGKVIINRKISKTEDTSALKLLDVNGDMGMNGIITFRGTTGGLYNIGSGHRLYFDNEEAGHWTAEGDFQVTNNLVAKNISVSTANVLTSLNAANVYCTDIIQGDSIAADTNMTFEGETVATRKWVEEYVEGYIDNDPPPAYNNLGITFWKNNISGGGEDEFIDSFTSASSNVTESLNLTYNYNGTHNIYTIDYTSREGSIAISCSTATLRKYQNYVEIIFNQIASHTISISDTGSGYGITLQVTISRVTYVD